MRHSKLIGDHPRDDAFVADTTEQVAIVQYFMKQLRDGSQKCINKLTLSDPCVAIFR